MEEPVVDDILALFVEFVQRAEYRNEDAAVCLRHRLVSFAEGYLKDGKENE